MPMWRCLIRRRSATSRHTKSRCSGRPERSWCLLMDELPSKMRSRPTSSQDARSGTQGSPNSIVRRTPLLPFFNGPRPIVLEQPRQRAIGEQLAAGLATWAVVALVFSMHDPLDRRAANGARLSKTPVNCHFRTKCSHLLWKLFGCLGGQSLGPATQHVPNSVVECRDLLIRQATCERDGRQPGGEENLITVGIADSREQPRIGQTALERMVLALQRRSKVR